MTSSVDPDSAATRIVAASRLLFTAGVMSPSGHANPSARTGGDRFRLTTSGTVRELQVDQLAAVTTAGEVVEGDLAAENAEMFAMHRVVYTDRPDVGVVIHTRSPAATAFALVHRELPCRTEPLLRFGPAEPGPVLPWGPQGSDVSVRGIASVLQESPTTSSRPAGRRHRGVGTFRARRSGARRWCRLPRGRLEAVRASMARA